VALELQCLDRLYLNAYVANLQVGGQVVRFLTEHLGNPVPSPALFEKIGNRFRRDVEAFAKTRGLPVLRLKKPDRTRWDDRKLDHVRPYLEAAERAGRFGVVAIVIAQEFQWVYTGRNRAPRPGAVCYGFDKSQRRVSTYYLSVGGPPVNGGSGLSLPGSGDRAVPQPGSSWSARSEARTNELDAGEERRTLCTQGEAHEVNSPRDRPPRRRGVDARRVAAERPDLSRSAETVLRSHDD
jgi:hypothetical protein